MAGIPNTHLYPIKYYSYSICFLTTDLKILTQLIFADIHQFFSRLHLDGSAALDVWLSTPSLKRLEGHIINELCLLKYMECVVVAFISLCHISPVQKMVIIYDTASKVTLAQHRNMFTVIFVCNLHTYNM